MWNNIYTYTNHERWLIATPIGENAGKPQISTFDIGTPSRLSRLTLFNWGYEMSYGSGAGDRLFYTGEHMRRFEIWGTMSPDPDGSLDSWIKLATLRKQKTIAAALWAAVAGGFRYGGRRVRFPLPGQRGHSESPVCANRNLESWDGTTKSASRRSTSSATRGEIPMKPVIII